jgi:hypothetical protein
MKLKSKRENMGAIRNIIKNLSQNVGYDKSAKSFRTSDSDLKSKLSSLGYSSTARSFRLASKPDNIRTTKLASDANSKKITDATASAISQGDTLLIDTRSFDVRRPINRSVINIYNPKNVNMTTVGDSKDKTTESERRELELEARRKETQAERAKITAQRMAMMSGVGIGAGAGVGSSEDEDSVVGDVAKATAAGAAGALLTRIKSLIRGTINAGSRILRPIRTAFSSIGSIGSSIFRSFGTPALSAGAISPRPTGAIVETAENMIKVGARVGEEAATTTRVARIGSRFFGGLKALGGPLAVLEMGTTQLALEQTEALTKDIENLGMTLNENPVLTSVRMMDMFAGQPKGLYHKIIYDTLIKIKQKKLDPLDSAIQRAKENLTSAYQSGDRVEISVARAGVITAEKARDEANLESLPSMLRLMDPAKPGLQPNNLDDLIDYHKSKMNDTERVPILTPEKRNEYLGVGARSGVEISDQEMRDLEFRDVDINFRARPVSSAVPSPAAPTTVPGVVGTSPNNVTIINQTGSPQPDRQLNTRNDESSRIRSYGIAPRMGNNGSGRASRFD